MKGVQFAWLDVAVAERDEGDHHRELHRDHDVVEPGRFLGAAHQKQREERDDQHRRQVHDRRAVHVAGELDRGAGRGGEAGRDHQPDILEQADDVARPADRHGGRAHGVFEDQVPADDPGEELAQGRVGVGVARSGHRDQRRHLGIAQPDEGAGDAAGHEGQHDPRAGILRGRRAGEHEDARPDDGADPHGDDREQSERFRELVPVALAAGDDVLDGLARRQAGGSIRGSHGLSDPGGVQAPCPPARDRTSRSRDGSPGFAGPGPSRARACRQGPCRPASGSGGRRAASATLRPRAPGGTGRWSRSDARHRFSTGRGGWKGEVSLSAESRHSASAAIKSRFHSRSPLQATSASGLSWSRRATPLPLWPHRVTLCVTRTGCGIWGWHQNRSRLR